MEIPEYPKLRKYLASIYDKNHKVEEILEENFHEKAFIIELILESWAVESNKSYGKTGFYFLVASGGVNDDMIVDVISEMLKVDYTPKFPTSEEQPNILTHMLVLMIFYRTIKPYELDLQTILRLDIACLKLTMYVASWAKSMLLSSKRSKQIDGVKRGKSMQFAATSREILEAYEDLNAQWDETGSKVQIIVYGKRYSLNRFATKWMILEQGIELDPRTIIQHLKKLHKSGNI